MNVRTSPEGPRGCGFRKPGRFYLVSDGPGRDCGRMPLKLQACTTCGSGVKPTRGWTWIKPGTLFSNQPCVGRQDCLACPLSQLQGPFSDPDARAGLLWVGEQFYASPLDFNQEAETMGISRFINKPPRKFVLGETWVFLAHRKTIFCEECQGNKAVVCECNEGMWSGVFKVFMPEAIEYIVKEDDTEEELERLEARGISLVKVIEQQQELHEETA